MMYFTGCNGKGATPKKVSGAIGERVGRVGEHIKEKKATNAFDDDMGNDLPKMNPKFEEGVMYNAFDDIQYRKR